MQKKKDEAHIITLERQSQLGQVAPSSLNNRGKKRRAVDYHLGMNVDEQMDGTVVKYFKEHKQIEDVREEVHCLINDTHQRAYEQTKQLKMT